MMRFVIRTGRGRGRGEGRGGRGEGKGGRGEGGTVTTTGRSVVFAKGANKYNIADQHQVAVIQPPTTNTGKNGGGAGKSGREVVLVDVVTMDEEAEEEQEVEEEEEEQMMEGEMVGDGEDGEGLYEGIEEEEEEESAYVSSEPPAVALAPAPVAPVSVPLTKEDIALQKQYEELRVLRQQADAIWSRKEDLLQGQIDQYRAMIGENSLLQTQSFLRNASFLPNNTYNFYNTHHYNTDHYKDAVICYHTQQQPFEDTLSCMSILLYVFLYLCTLISFPTLFALF